ncbi:MAG TPA: SMP-30/gluconolactonase/LRE family protein [Alphaproteobacteria bacterium]|jgi:sugar lactone lactonase YvrE|nr:SMP-30/gluconolactonase/LRE family protein [Alphaproteobacteria bacterium]
MEFETLASGWEFLEAPRLDVAGNLYFSDVTLGGLHKLLPNGKVESFLPGRTWIGGIAFNDDGGIICSGKDGLVCFYEKTGTVKPVFSALGAINDFCPDGAGGVIAGVIDAESVAAARAPEGRPLIRVSPSGQAIRLWDGITISNGIGFSPDGKRLYQSESYKTLWVYDVASDGTMSNRRVFADIQDADGLTVDAEGGVLVARFDSFGVTRFRPDGSVDRHYEVPVREAQSVSLAGPDLKDLYIVTGSSFANPNNLTDKTGTIYRGRADVPGQPTAFTRFR